MLYFDDIPQYRIELVGQFNATPMEDCVDEFPHDSSTCISCTFPKGSCASRCTLLNICTDGGLRRCEPRYISEYLGLT